MIDKFYELVVGENGFILIFRCDNRFDEEKYVEIKNILEILVGDWKEKKEIPKKAFLAIVELMECLVGGSRFLSEDAAIRVEDASIEIKDIINALYQTL